MLRVAAALKDATDLCPHYRADAMAFAFITIGAFSMLQQRPQDALAAAVSIKQLAPTNHCG